MTDCETVFEAIVGGNVDQLKQLLAQNGALASCRDQLGVSALMTAAYHRNSEMVELLRNEITESDLFEAAALGQADRVRELLSDPDAVSMHSPDGFLPLHLAAFFDRPNIVEILLQAGADVDAVADNPSRVRPLHSGAASRSQEVVRLLLNAGANPNSAQNGGWTALQAAAKHGDLELVTLLLHHGADPHQAADSGETAITMASDDAIRACLNAH